MDIPLAVNGTLMRGLELNGNLISAGARFLREASTTPEYRLWSIGDRHPAMLRVRQGGAANEPSGLCIGKVRLSGGDETLGVLGEPLLCEGQREITTFGGWRAYVAARVTS